MPIKPELRYLYPIDWKQVSHWVRFVRAKGRCQGCGRPHGAMVRHLGDGRWWDEAGQAWRDGRRALGVLFSGPLEPSSMAAIRDTSRPVLRRCSGKALR